MNPFRVCAVGVAIALTSGTPALGSDRIVASVKPVHSLVAAVMGDTGRPFLIVGGGASPHSYTLKPSIAKKISAAKVIFWIGDRLETSLANPIRALGRKARLVTLSGSPGLKTLTFREGGLFQTRATAGHDNHTADETDNHFWLDPVNATIFAGQIEHALSVADPQNTARYNTNARALRERLDALTGEIRQRLRPVRHRPFIVFHDAYQYFENRFGLTAVGSIVVNPDRKPGARRLSAIRKKIADSGALCVFAEPQFTPKIVQVVTRGTRARTDILDPIGADLPAGPDLYFTLMRNMAAAIANCLGAPGTRR